MENFNEYIKVKGANSKVYNKNFTDEDI